VSYCLDLIVKWKWCRHWKL